MKKLLTALLLATCATVASAEGIEIKDAWARFTVQGQKAGGVFMQLANTGKEADRLIGGQSPVADKIEIHTHSMQNGRMAMHELEGGLALASGSQTELKPGGLHIMLIGLKQPLQVGQKFPLTLRFEHGQAQTIEVQVRSPQQEMQHNHGHEHQHDHNHAGHDHDHDHHH